MRTPVDFNLPVQTRNGQSVTHLTVLHYCVSGVLGGIATTWSLAGFHRDNSDLDLVNVPEITGPLRLDQPVRTRDGREVKELTVFNCVSCYPVAGVLNGKLELWTRDGKCRDGAGQEKNLVNVPLNHERKS